MKHIKHAYLHAWNTVFAGLPKPFWHLIKYLIEQKLDIKNFWHTATKNHLEETGISPVYIDAFLNLHNKFDPLKEYEKLQKQDIKLLSVKDKAYPYLLKHLNKHDPPVLLYVKGEIPDNSDHFISIVGTRQMTDYGEQAAHLIVNYLERYNATIVSGMATGIDSVAHKAALDNNMKTIAVLGFGFYHIPYFVRSFAEQISEHGALVSEYPPELQAQKYHFPLRNRIISGLSKATIVVEAGEKSGACITAQYALDQCREVFSVPGDINKSKSAGTNFLLKTEAAHVLTRPSDIAEIMGFEEISTVRNVNLSKYEQSIMEALKNGPKNQAELLSQCLIKPTIFQRTITELELKGYIEQNAHGKYLHQLN